MSELEEVEERPDWAEVVARAEGHGACACDVAVFVFVECGDAGEYAAFVVLVAHVLCEVVFAC